MSLTLLAAASSTGCFSVEAEVPEMEVSHRGLEFQSAPQGSGAEAAPVTSRFTHQHEPLDVPSDVDAEIRATEVALVARDGTPDLSFIEHVELTLLGQGQAQEETMLILDYDRPEGASNLRNLVMPVVEAPNALEQWKTPASEYAMTVWGKLPQRAWSVDITVTFSGKFAYQP